MRHMVGRCKGGALGKKKNSWQTVKSGAAGAKGVCAGEVEVGQFGVVSVLQKYHFKVIIKKVIIEAKLCEKKHLAQFKQKNSFENI